MKMKITLNLYFHCTILSLLIHMFISSPIEFDMELKSNIISNATKLFKIKASIPSDLVVLPKDVLTLRTCIGSPEQCFNLVYDTGSYILWVASKNDTGCTGCKIFDQTLSDTYRRHKDNNLIRLQYVTGGALGYLGTDIVKIDGQNQNMTMDFMVADQIAFDVKGADGIIGFGRSYQSNRNNKYPKGKGNSIIERLVETGLAPRKVFSQKFTNPEKTKAKLFVGDLHEDFANGTNVTSCNIFPNDPLSAIINVGDMWTCRLSYLIFGENDVNNFDKNALPVYSRAVFDSGTNYIAGPYSDILPFRKYFEGIWNCVSEKDSFRGITGFYCDLDFDPSSLPKISFVLNGIAYHIPPELLFKDYTNLGLKKRVFTIFFFNKLDFWLLGQVFMKNYHILYDRENNTVSFSALDEKYISDVSSKTNDADFLLSDYYSMLIISMFILIVIITLSLILLILHMRKRRVQNETTINSNYALLNMSKNKSNI